MTKEDIITTYRVMLELESNCTHSNHNAIVVVKNLMANKLMEIELNSKTDSIVYGK